MEDENDIRLLLEEENSTKELTDLEAQRLDVEWATLIAIREMLGIALKGNPTPTYEQSLAFAKTLAPKLYNPKTSLLGKTKEQQIIQEYTQRAEAQSQLDGQKVEPIEIVDKEIEHFNQLLKPDRDRDLLQKRLNTLKHIKRLLSPKSYTENQLILRDLFKAERHLPGPPIEGDTYRDYQISEDRGLRMRLLHPDPPEHSTGADLIYEQYWDDKRVARLAIVQYKVWDGETLYFSQANNLEQQMRKLKVTFCDADLCKAYKGSARTDAYRLPFCSAFLRPTDQLQHPDSRLITSGLHVPICVALKSIEPTARAGKKIIRKNIRSESISHKVFEELFNTNMLGSRWITYDQMEELYRKHRILDIDERIILHAQEFGL